MIRPPLRVLHIAAFAGLIAAILALTMIVAIPLPAQIAALGVLVALLGIPHGAFDLDIARAIWPLEGRRAEIAFTAYYVGLVALGAGLWWLVPSLALVLFLGYSSLHFADDWQTDLGPLSRIAGGAVAVAAPILLRPDEVATIFALLVPDAAAMPIVRGFSAASLAAIAFAASVILRAGRKAVPAGLELSLLLAAAWALPPLVYFVLYFCGLHSPRHFVRTARDLGYGPMQSIRATWRLSAVTIAFSAACGWAFVASGTPMDGAVVGTVFIALSTLTVPHMILVDRFRARNVDSGTDRTAFAGQGDLQTAKADARKNSPS